MLDNQKVVRVLHPIILKSDVNGEPASQAGQRHRVAVAGRCVTLWKSLVNRGYLYKGKFLLTGRSANIVVVWRQDRSSITLRSILISWGVKDETLESGPVQQGPGVLSRVTQHF